MKKVNFDFKMLDLTGKAISDYNTKEVVANLMVSGTTKHSIRMYELARKVMSDGSIELLSEDAAKIKEAIENSRISDLVKAQILIAMAGADIPE